MNEDSEKLFALSLRFSNYSVDLACERTSRSGKQSQSRGDCFVAKNASRNDAEPSCVLLIMHCAPAPAFARA